MLGDRQEVQRGERQDEAEDRRGGREERGAQEAAGRRAEVQGAGNVSSRRAVHQIQHWKMLLSTVKVRVHETSIQGAIYRVTHQGYGSALICLHAICHAYCTRFVAAQAELARHLNNQFNATKCSRLPYKSPCTNLNNMYREVNKGLYVVARNFVLLLLNCSAWPCLGPA